MNKTKTMSELALHRIREAKHKQLKRLDLGNCDLLIIPDELFELTWLEELYLSSEGVFYDFDKNETIYFKSQNREKPNCINSLLPPISIFKIFYSQKLNWENLINLKILSIKGVGKGEEYRDIEPLKYLINLQQLDISNTYVRNLNPLKYLSELRLLNISSTQVKDLIPLKGLDNLDRLYSENISLRKFNWLITKLKTEISMTLEELKNQVRTLISKAKTKDAMETVATWAHEHNQEQLKDDINLLKAELTTLNRNTTLGLVSHSDTIIQQNQLNNKVMSLVNAIDVSESKTYTHLENVQPKEPIHKKTMDKPLSIFISYSKNDNDLRQELHTHLSSLRRRNIVSNWDDRHIIGGELWDDTIKTKLREADIILFLVSASFINTDYIWDHEIPIAEEQRRNGKARVIPIILKPCQWTKLDFAKQQALPSKGVPINSFQDRDTAWLEVVESIEKVINDVMS